MTDTLPSVSAEVDEAWDDLDTENALTRRLAASPLNATPDPGEVDDGWDVEDGAPPGARDRAAKRAKRGHAAREKPAALGESGVAPRSLTKKERRELERQRRIIAVQREAQRKQEQKQRRLERAREAAEQRRLEEQARAKRVAKSKPKPHTEPAKARVPAPARSPAAALTEAPPDAAEQQTPSRTVNAPTVSAAGRRTATIRLVVGLLLALSVALIAVALLRR